MGGLYYANQVLLPVIGSKTAAGVTTGITLESTYQAENAGVTTATKTFDVGGMSRVEFAIAYTMGATESANSLEMIVEWTPDDVNFYRLTNDTTANGTSTMTRREFTYVGENATTSKITWGVDIAYKDRIRVSFKETGVATNKGTVYVEALVSGR